MNQYLLFIDTEASGLPKNWGKPYFKENNWPYAVQVSWLIYTSSGEELKREDHYIGNNDFEISRSSIKIHGITREFLSRTGEDRKKVMQSLSDDLKKYQPVIIGHFMELDYHVLAADFYRSQLENPIADLSLPVFCTMMASKKYVRNPQRKFLKLGELYDTLFNTILLNPHNAIADAKATADCFFEMIRRGDIDTAQIDAQKLDLSIKPGNKSGWLFFSAIFLLVLIVILWI